MGGLWPPNPIGGSIQHKKFHMLGYPVGGMEYSGRRGVGQVSGFKGKCAIYLHSRENLPYMEKFGKFGPSRPRPARHPTPIIPQGPGFVNT